MPCPQCVQEQEDQTRSGREEKAVLQDLPAMIEAQVSTLFCFFILNFVVIVAIWLTVVFGVFFSDLNGDIEFKCEMNRIKMQNYRCDKMTDRQKDRYREVNRKTAAANHLKRKLEESARKHLMTEIGNRNVGF